MYRRVLSAVVILAATTTIAHAATDDAIVYIRTANTADPKPGTGFLISPEGFIITARHLVQAALGSGPRLEVRLRSPNAQPVPVRSIMCDVSSSDAGPDACVVKIDAVDVKAADIVAFPLLSCRILDNEETVRTVGASGGPGDPLQKLRGSLTGGLGQDIQYTSNLQISPGASGGPVFDDNGYVAGLIKGRRAEITYFTPIFRIKGLIENNVGILCPIRPARRGDMLIPHVVGEPSNGKTRGLLTNRIVKLVTQWSAVKPPENFVATGRLDHFLEAIARGFFSKEGDNWDEARLQKELESSDGKAWLQRWGNPRYLYLYLLNAKPFAAGGSTVDEIDHVLVRVSFEVEEPQVKLIALTKWPEEGIPKLASRPIEPQHVLKLLVKDLLVDLVRHEEGFVRNVIYASCIAYYNHNDQNWPSSAPQMFYQATHDAWPEYTVQFAGSEQCESTYRERIYQNPPLVGQKLNRDEKVDEVRDRIRISQSEVLPKMMITTEIVLQKSGGHQAIAKVFVVAKTSGYQFFNSPVKQAELKKAETLVGKRIPDMLKSQWNSVIKWINETPRGPR